ncbi:chemotaxis protein CheA [Pseudobacteroides cellulosolvens]|uniref:Chemotaxis protein CheA n=1 Tax=Pseudobacteroides cellulosolvens ATCC 35603 = DSM 2933 TaxID=398512 RepID=A0A0L6JKA2_9FIRM|nr:chemotaxis protein CheA [Pseudobacteroides cellulosolvens]KNY26286.1 CheA signal transduction histidine kinase [Pseudobacteroides cellulosolvens ATCC 35603 = DSM 2933]
MGYTFAGDDLELLKSFIEEATEYIEGLEKELLKLESNDENSELVNDIFRRVHSIKGLSSFLSFVCITKLSHHIEFALDSIRKKKTAVRSELIDCLLESIDLLGSFIYSINEQLKDTDSMNGHNEIEIILANEDKLENVINNIQNILDKKDDDSSHTSFNQHISMAEDSETNNKQEQSGQQGGETSSEESGDNQPDVDILNSEEFKKKLASGFKEQFVVEATEHIERIEGDLLVKLDKSGDDYDTINDLFRCIHSIKGGTGIINSTLQSTSPISPVVKNVSIVTHSFENILAAFRDKKLVFNKHMVSLGYEVVDYLKACVDAVNNNQYVDIPIQDLIGRINRSLDIDQGPENNVVRENTYIEEVKPKDLGQKSTVLQSIRVGQDKLDKMMNTIAELITTKNSFMHVSKRLNIEYNIPELAKEVKEIGFAINRISDELQNTIMSVRMVEVRNVFQKMPRIIRDISQSTGKKINLIMEGEDTEIDKTIIEQISDPLVHIIRNAADHGIEDTETRRIKGKSDIGTINLRAYNRNKHVFIEVEDDGKGIDSTELKQKAIDKGFIKSAEAENMSRSQLLNLIFLPGFSTAKKVTEVSGRGVGMDIVKSNISKINGLIHIESEVDKGTKMIIQLPLTLAVSRGLLVEVMKENYIIPIENIVETVKINISNIHEYNKKYFTHLRGEVVGVEWLSRIFMLDNDCNRKGSLEDEVNSVVISNGVEKVAVIVDKLKNEQEFVVKTLSDCLASIPGISGSTLLGNGQVVLILNPTDIIRMADKSI